jgi:integrase
MLLDDFLERYHRSAVSRGLRRRSIRGAKEDFRRIARDLGVKRLVELTPQAMQQWVERCELKAVTLRSRLKNAGSVFAKPSLHSLGMVDVPNPFANLVKPKVDREPFAAPPRAWIQELMRQGIEGLTGEPRLGFVLALGAGLRWGEITSLNWENVQPGSVRIAAEKAAEDALFRSANGFEGFWRQPEVKVL